MSVPTLGLFHHISENRGTAAEVVGVDAEEKRPANKDDVSGCQIKVWMLWCDVAFVRGRDVWVDEWCIPRSQC